jgi:uncharacterized protein
MNKFKPKPGQIDYSRARWAPVINCVLKFGDKILIVQRSRKLHFYPGYWSGVSGFLDDDKSLEQKVKEEINEELGIKEENILDITLGEIFNQDELEYKKTWIVHPILAEVNTDKVKLDWEAQDYRWVSLNEIKSFKLMSGFDIVLMKLSKWMKA